jgi:carboxyl-terminal processing protease
VRLKVVSRPGEARTVRLERASVQLPVAPGRIKRAAGHKAAYVRFVTFSEGSHGELRSTLERLYRRGAEGLVLDLRGNGGGLLNEAVLSASIFLNSGQRVVSTDSRTMGHKTYDAVGDPLDPRPTVVLINRDTASAAEILASALEDHGLATIVGTRSYGKGTFQEVIHLAAGGALDLTVGQYFTADGTSLAGKGIKPQVRAVDDPKTKPDEGLDRALQVLGAKLTR